MLRCLHALGMSVRETQGAIVKPILSGLFAAALAVVAAPAAAGVFLSVDS
jgi:hypothetical protein